jgi:hypothetical protein
MSGGTVCSNAASAHTHAFGASLESVSRGDCAEALMDVSEKLMTTKLARM